MVRRLSPLVALSAVLGLAARAAAQTPIDDMAAWEREEAAARAAAAEAGAGDDGAADGGTREQPTVAEGDASAASADAAPAPPLEAREASDAGAGPAPADPPRTRDFRFIGALGLSLPRLLSVDALVARSRPSDPRWPVWAAGISFEYLPPSFAKFGEKTTVSWLQIGAQGRFHPWRFLYVGGAVGYQFVRADSEKFAAEVDYVVSGLYLSPKVGVLHAFANGLTIGADLGATIPIAPSVELISDGTEDSNARKVAKTFGQFVLPQLTLIRVGYTF